MAKSLMDQMRLDKQQRKAAIDLFDQGKHTDFPLNDVLHQFRNECQRRTTVLRMFIEIQVQAAMADGRLDPKKTQFSFMPRTCWALISRKLTI